MLAGHEFSEAAKSDKPHTQVFKDGPDPSGGGHCRRKIFDDH